MYIFNEANYYIFLALKDQKGTWLSDFNRSIKS